MAARRRRTIMHKPAPATTRTILCALILLSTAVRAHALEALPGFLDEGQYLRWAAEVWEGSLLFPLSSAKALQIYWLALLNPLGPVLYVGRAASVLASTVTLSALWALARCWGRPQAGLWAVAFYVLQPWAFFFERLTTADTLLATAVVVLAWLASTHARRARPAARVLALAMLAVPLTKFSGLFCLALPALAHALQPLLKPHLRQLLVAYALALGGLTLLLTITALRYGALGFLLGGSRPGNTSWLAMTRLNLTDLNDSVRLYLGAPGLLVLAGALLALLRRDRLLLFALAGVVCGGLIFTITGARSFSRYYMPGLVFAALLAGAALQWLAQRSSSLLSAALLLGCAAYFSSFARSAYADPEQLPLSAVDRIQYITGTSAGYGFGATAAFVAAQVAREPQAVVFGYDLPARDILRLYWHDRASGNPHVLWDEHAPPVIDLVARGTPVFVVVDLTEDVANFNGLTIRPQELARFARPAGGSPIAVYKLLAEPFAFPPP